MSKRNRNSVGNQPPVGDWKAMPDGKEKYNAYLCSREWNEKKEAVKARCGGKCERCRRFPMTACHHLTYARKYNEDLEDLQAICQGCHDFTHAKSDRDPLAMPVVIEESVYLAGKISRGDWRSRICQDIRDDCGRPAWTVRREAIKWEYKSTKFCCHYSGPFFTSAGHGQDHGNGTHGVAGASSEMHHRDSVVFGNCLAAIRESTAVLAWFDDLFQYGTICELGYAHAHGVPVVIGHANHIERYASELWFPFAVSRWKVYGYQGPEEFVQTWLDVTAQRKLDHGF